MRSRSNLTHGTDGLVSELIPLNELNMPPGRFPLLSGWACLIHSGHYFINAQQHISAVMGFHFHQDMIEFFWRVKILVHGIFLSNIYKSNPVKA